MRHLRWVMILAVLVVPTVLMARLHSINGVCDRHDRAVERLTDQRSLTVPMRCLEDGDEAGFEAAIDRVVDAWREERAAFAKMCKEFGEFLPDTETADAYRERMENLARAQLRKKQAEEQHAAGIKMHGGDSMESKTPATTLRQHPARRTRFAFGPRMHGPPGPAWSPRAPGQRTAGSRNAM